MRSCWYSSLLQVPAVAGAEEKTCTGKGSLWRLEPQPYSHNRSTSIRFIGLFRAVLL